MRGPNATLDPGTTVPFHGNALVLAPLSHQPPSPAKAINPAAKQIAKKDIPMRACHSRSSSFEGIAFLKSACVVGGEARHSSISIRASPMDCSRFLASFCKHRRIRLWIRGGVVEGSRDQSGSFERIAEKVSVTVSSSNATRRVSISKHCLWNHFTQNPQSHRYP